MKIYSSVSPVEELVRTLGHPNDDADKSVTARLLLLLESKPLFGDDVYWEAIDQVIAAYWGDFADRKNEFVPAFLTNDILRIWRTFCVNYEARTSGEPGRKEGKAKAEELQAETQPPAHLLLRDSLLARGFRSSEDGYSG